MTSLSLQLSNSAVADRQSETEPQTVSSQINSSRSILSLQASKLPYQVDQQVELLHLRAEAEALLQELQSIKQRRLVALSGNTSN